MKPGVKNPALSMEDSARDRAKAKSLAPSTKIARAEGHGLTKGQVKEMGLHTSQYFTGPKPAKNPIQRLNGVNDGMSEHADRVNPGFIGGR